MLPDESKIALPVPVLGSRFGSSHGFTQRGATGGEVVFDVPAPPVGLYASEVAEAATITCVLPQMRAKNVGKLACTRTVTVGFVGGPAKTGAETWAAVRFTPPT